MLDDAPRSPRGAVRGAGQGSRGKGAWDGDSFAGALDSTFDCAYDDLEAFTVALRPNTDDHDDGDADEQELSFSADSKSVDTLDVDVSPWAPLLGMLDSTEPDALAGYRPFAPAEGVEKAHALEFRSESMLHYAARGARRTGELDRTEVGLSDDNRDVIAGRDQVEVDGMLDEHMGHGLVHVADEVELNVGGPLRMDAHLEDNIIMAGVMTDEFAGGTLVAAAMSDDMAAGVGLRCTAPLDLWVHGLTEMEERPGDVRGRRAAVRARGHTLRARVRLERARRGGHAAPGHRCDDDEDGLPPADEDRHRSAEPHPGRRRWRRSSERLSALRAAPGSGRR